MNSDVIKISTANVIETASAKSRRIGGSGRMRITRIVMMPSASPISPRRSMVPKSASRDNVVSPLSTVVVSLIPVDAPRLRSRDPKLWVAAGMPLVWRIGPALASKAGPEEQGGKDYAVELRQAGTPPVTPSGQNLPGLWLPAG